jgi:hypothetical protein
MVDGSGTRGSKVCSIDIDLIFEINPQKTRHAFRFRDSDASGLEDWHTQRPRLDKDFKLRRINMPKEDGLVVDCAQAWRCLADRATDLAANHSERPIRPSDLILGLLKNQHFCIY